jgi:hypothetical protein
MTVQYNGYGFLAQGRSTQIFFAWGDGGGPFQGPLFFTPITLSTGQLSVTEPTSEITGAIEVGTTIQAKMQYWITVTNSGSTDIGDFSIVQGSAT